MLIANPSCTYGELQRTIDINMSAIQKQLKSLMNKGYIMRKDGGDWRVSVTQSK